jgi:hypothetical protein
VIEPRLARWLAAEWRDNRTGAAMAMAFLALVVPLALFCAMLVPPGEVADEHAHAARAASIALGEFAGFRQFVPSADGGHRMSGVRTDPVAAGVGFVFRTQHRGTVTPQSLAAAGALRWSGQPAFQAIGVLATYFPLFYLPAAAAFAIARHAHMHPFAGFILARLGNVAAFALIGAAALLLARRAHGLLFCVLAVPMEVSLAGSLNQDGLAIATAVLAAALLTRQGPDGAPGIGISRLAAALCLLGVILSKPSYLPLAALLLLPLAWDGRRTALALRLALVAAVLAAGLVWSSWVAGHIVAVNPMPAYQPGPLWSGPRPTTFTATDPVAQLRILLAHPVRFVTLGLGGIVSQPRLAREMVGVLGWLDVTLPPALYWLWPLAAGLALAGALAGPRRGAARRWPDMLLVTVVLAGCMTGVSLSLYLTWTRVGAATVDGIQGRYLLPLVPMLALLPRLAVPGGRVLRAAGLALPVAAALAGLAMIPRLLVLTYYLH